MKGVTTFGHINVAEMLISAVLNVKTGLVLRLKGAKQLYGAASIMER